MNNTKNWIMDDFTNQLVMVYQDPITKKDLEGYATLIEPVKFDNENDLSIWLVEFDNEPNEHYQRTIDRKDIIIE